MVSFSDKQKNSLRNHPNDTKIQPLSSFFQYEHIHIHTLFCPWSDRVKISKYFPAIVHLRKLFEIMTMTLRVLPVCWKTISLISKLEWVPLSDTTRFLSPVQKTERPVFMISLNPESRSVGHWPLAVAKQWLGWYSGVNFNFYGVMPFLVAPMVHPLSARYLHHSDKKTKNKQKKPTIVEKNLLAVAWFSAVRSPNIRSPRALSPCYINAKSSFIPCLSLVIITLSHCMLLVLSTIHQHQFLKFAAFLFSLFEHSICH